MQDFVWRDHNLDSISQHIFVMKWKNRLIVNDSQDNRYERFTWTTHNILLLQCQDFKHVIHIEKSGANVVKQPQ